MNAKDIGYFYIHIPVSQYLRDRLLALLALAVVVCSLAMQFCVPARAQNVPNADLLRMKGVFLQNIKKDEAAIANAESLLDRAHAAHNQAVTNGDNDGGFVTAEAIGNAQQALDKGKQNLADDQARLDAVNHAMVLWTSIGDRTGPRALATIVRGQIMVDTPQGRKPFDPYAPIQPGQHIRVGAGSFLELQLGDGGEMHIGPNSDFLYERDVQGVYWQLFRGELHKITVIMGVRGANDEPGYRGITSIAAVRGTDFTLAIDGQQDTYMVLEGEIEVDPGAGRPKVTLTGGQQLVVPKAGEVGPPIAIDRKGMPHWWER